MRRFLITIFIMSGFLFHLYSTDLIISDDLTEDTLIDLKEIETEHTTHPNIEEDVLVIVESDELHNNLEDESGDVILKVKNTFFYRPGYLWFFAGTIVGSYKPNYVLQVSLGFNWNNDNSPVYGAQWTLGLNYTAPDSPVYGGQWSLAANIARSNVYFSQLTLGANIIGKNLSILGIQSALGANVMFDGSTVKGLQLSLGGNVVTKFSSVYGIQASTGFNLITRYGNFYGAQSSLAFNFIGSYSNFIGIQTSLGANILLDYGEGSGIQNALGVNIIGNFTEFTGIQSSLLANYAAGKYNGLQLALIFNMARDTTYGLQMSLFANIAEKNLRGAQITTGGNLNKKLMKGVQWGRLFNVAQTLYGLQFGSGVWREAYLTTYWINYGVTRGNPDIPPDNFFNDLHPVLNTFLDVLTYAVGPSIVNVVQKDMYGGQIGIVNVGGNVNGFQLGLVNYATRLTGIQIGLVNIVKPGGGAIPFMPLINIGIGKPLIKRSEKDKE